MKPFQRLVDAGADHTKLAIVVMVLLTVGIGAGMPMVEQSSSLDQFRTESKAGEKMEYIEENFQAQENTTTVQIIVRGENVLTKGSLLSNLRFQKRLRRNDTVGPTLTDGTPTVSIANVVATRAIVQEEVAELRRLTTRAKRLNASLQAKRRALQRNRSRLQTRRDALNATVTGLREALTALRQNPDADVRAAFERVNASTPVALTTEDFETFRRAAELLRSANTRSEIENAYKLGTRGVLKEEFAALQERAAALKERAAALKEKGRQLRELGAKIESQRVAIENATTASLDAEIAQLESMNASAVTATVRETLRADGGSNRVFSFMPTTYEPGTATAEATMILVTQTTKSASQVQGAAPDRIIESQLAIQDIAQKRSDGLEYLVFGQGIIAEEIDNSMTDSLLIVGPLALLFVLLTLIIAYRDLLDIVLGVLGIGSVLIWTFGFMGWANIDFNQIFIAVPVLLIGLSIDYAIHIFMRHREERVQGDGLGPRESMRIALGGVGIALVWVTATTVIGFLSNLISPVPPIRDFGVVSAVGIVAAFLVFGVLVPSLKVELDEVLEGVGLNREKRAFGTGGGRFSQVLALGSTAAKKSPYLVILLVLLVSATGAYGATKVDTSFDQEDFLASDPPDWMKDLPEPFAPSTYTIKSNLEYVNERFVRENSQAQILLQGSIATPEALDRIAAAEDRAAKKDVTQILSNGEADITSPLSVIHSVAAQNATMNATLAAADTDGDGVPDRNVKAVYDTLFAVAPDRASNVIHREGGQYRAARMIISIRGGVSGDTVKTQMENLAASIDGGRIEVTATGGPILNTIVQNELLRTVIESLIITLVAIFAFLMVAYRLTEGSASLGAVTLLPVALTVSWILGTMSLLGIPFNAVTGLITSLTVGLGVAYSIHLSERYTQELERSEDVWSAMRTAVTGTGGALLGSAATTVGGFGVLAFAILPPLQQFGIITGMTIIYAFLAAVLVLPSLLVVWTKYVGPEWAKRSLRGGDEETPGGGSSPEAADVPESTANPDAGSEVADATGGADAADEEWSAAVTTTDEAMGTTRELSASHVSPGDTVSVTTTVEAQEDRAILIEDADGLQITVEEVTADPVDVAVRDDRLYVVWEDGDTRRVRYEVAIPTNIMDGSELTIDGTLLTAEGEWILPESSLTVVEGFFERILATGDVTEEELVEARERAERGELTEQQLREVYRVWLDRSEGTIDDFGEQE